MKKTWVMLICYRAGVADVFEKHVCGLAKLYSVEYRTYTSLYKGK
jgi:hypothetical protein